MKDPNTQFKFKSKLIAILSAILALCSTSILAQEIMERVYSPPGGNELENVFPASDGGAWVLMEFGRIVKVDDNLDVEWSDSYTFSNNTRLITLAETNDSGVILGGSTFSSLANNPIPVLLKISETGEVIWAKSVDLDNIEHVQSVLNLGNQEFVAVCKSENGNTVFAYFNEDGSSFSFAKPHLNGESVEVQESIRLHDDSFLIGGVYFEDEINGQVFYISKINGQISQWSKTYTYETFADPALALSLASTTNGDIGLSSRILSSSGNPGHSVVLLRLNVDGELKWGKKMSLGTETQVGLNTGLVAGSDNEMRQSFLFWTSDTLRASHFSGWDEEGNALFAEAYTTLNGLQYYGYKYYDSNGIYALSSEYIEPTSLNLAGVLTLQGPQGEMPCGEISEDVAISEMLPEVSDISLELVDSDGNSTNIEVNHQSSNVASYDLCSITLSTLNTDVGKRINIYPNPAKNNVFFDLSKIETESTLIQIFDELGREVYRQNGVRESLYSLSKESIGSGFFIARISNSRSGELLSHGKFVVR